MKERGGRGRGDDKTKWRLEKYWKKEKKRENDE